MIVLFIAYLLRERLHSSESVLNSWIQYVILTSSFRREINLDGSSCLCYPFDPFCRTEGVMSSLSVAQRVRISSCHPRSSAIEANASPLITEIQEISI
jgi:hypothetical protein